jgi:hypothetical protein
MSELTVGTISGLAANGYVVDVAPGSSLDLSAGAVFPPGSVVQVLQKTKTDVYSASLSSGQQSSITGLFQSITPKSTSNKILVTVSFMGGISLSGGSSDTALGIILKRGSTEIGIGDVAGSRQLISGTSSTMATFNGGYVTGSFMFLDSPASTSSALYSVDICHNSSLTQTVYLNRTDADTDAITRYRGSSSITVMEIAG